MITSIRLKEVFTLLFIGIHGIVGIVKMRIRSDAEMIGCLRCPFVCYWLLWAVDVSVWLVPYIVLSIATTIIYVPVIWLLIGIIVLVLFIRHLIAIICLPINEGIAIRLIMSIVKTVLILMGNRSVLNTTEGTEWPGTIFSDKWLVPETILRIVHGLVVVLWCQGGHIVDSVEVHRWYFNLLF